MLLLYLLCYVPVSRLSYSHRQTRTSGNPLYDLIINFVFKARCPAPMGLIANRSDITWTPIRNNDISWNFQKWLVKHDGQPFKRYLYSK